MTSTLKRYKLRQLIEATRGQSLAGEYYSEQGDKIRLTLANFDYQNGGFKEDLQKTDIYYTGPVKPHCLLNKGDIITPLTEQTPGLLGSTARIPESGKYVQSGDVALIKCNEELIDPSFCYYLLPSSQVKKQLASGSQQTKIRHTSPDAIKNCIVDIPDIEQQRKIGKLLDAITEKIDENRKQNAILEKLAKQIYDYWFVQFDFPDENGKPYKSSGGKMVWNETLKREIPEGWEVKKIGDICPAEKGSLITKKDAVPGHIKVVAAGLDFSYYHNASNRPANTITVSGSGENAGFTRLWREEIFASDCSTIVHNNIVDVYITYYTLKSYGPWLYRIARKSAQPHIYPADVNDLYRIVPPVNVIDKIESNFHSINSQISLLQTESEDLLSLRSYLLPILMTGQAKL